MRILLCVVGVGAGNSTRNLALLGEMRRLAPDVDIHVAAQGRALEVLGAVYTAHPLREITYSTDGRFGAWSIVRSNMSFPKRFLENRAAARRLIERLKPDVVLADSDFYCLGPARRLGVRLVSINNSAAVVADMRRHGIPPGCGFSARFIEQTDCWLQERYPDQVICPVLQREETLGPKYVQIPPIVREGFAPRDSSLDSAPAGEEVVVVTGGSGIGADEIDLRGVDAPIATYGTRLSKIPPHARQLGFNLNDAEPMRRARVLVIQGGFSSVSEALAVRRPTVVVPIARHAEQHVNARQAEALGLGLAAEGPDAGAAVRKILSNYKEYEARSGAISLPSDGARQAARAILETH